MQEQDRLVTQPFYPTRLLLYRKGLSHDSVRVFTACQDAMLDNRFIAGFSQLAAITLRKNPTMSYRVTATALRFCRTGYDAAVELCVLGLQTSNSIATRFDWLGSNGFDGGVPILSGLGSNGCNADGVFCPDSELAQRHTATITTTTINPHTAILPKATNSPGLCENGKTVVRHCGYSSPI